ncbi:hypothetical protein ACFL5O_10900 [Myxococcota bacterium]
MAAGRGPLVLDDASRGRAFKHEICGDFGNAGPDTGTLDYSDLVRVLLVATTDGLEKLYPPDLARFNLSSRDRVPARSGHPVRTLAERVGAIFGVNDFQFFVQPAHQGRLEVEFTDPISIIVPRYLSRLAEPQQVFLLGRVMSDIARQTYAVDRLTPQELGTFLQAALCSARPGLGPTNAESESLREYARKVYKSLSRRGRRGLEEVAERYHPTTKLDPVDWVHKTKMAGARTALIVADELAGCVTLLRQTEGDLAGIDAATAGRGVATAQDLLRFWISETAMSLRHRLGLAG